MVKNTAALVIILTLGVIMAFIVVDMPQFGSPLVPDNNRVTHHYLEKSEEEVGSHNIVSAVVVNYRGYDTLFEMIVLYTVSISVMAILYRQKD